MMDLGRKLPRVGIIGGGIMGLSLGYFLSRRGASVEIYEASPVLGGLAGPIELPDGTRVDRFYHAILSSDQHLINLCQELGIADQLRFKETRMGFTYRGRIYPMNNMVDFLRFPPLNWIDRFRLGLTVLAAGRVKDWRSLESVNVEDWLVRLGGKRLFDNIWRPMLQAKFDGDYSQVPATYIWSRLVRMKSTRKGVSQKELAGHLIGGYLTLVEAMRQAIEAAGGRVFLSAPVSEVGIEKGRAWGLWVRGEFRPYDAVVATLQAPVFRRMIPEGAADAYRQTLASTEYLGVIAPLLVLDRPLTGYWTLNLTEKVPAFTGVIETTTYIDPGYVGGHHLVYLPKYTAPGNSLQGLDEDEIRQRWLTYLERLIPRFRQEWVRYFRVHRERFVEPLHYIGVTDPTPDLQTPIKDLYLATTAQIYPDLTNGESVSRHARQAANLVWNDLSAKLSLEKSIPIRTMEI